MFFVSDKIKLHNWYSEATCLVNLHPLFLFWKHGSVCEPEKKVQNMGCKKQGAKKQGHCYSKREEAAYLIVSTTETPLPSYKSWRVRYFYMLHIFSIWLATPKPVLFWIVQTLHRLFSIYFRKSGSKKNIRNTAEMSLFYACPPTKRENHCHSVFFQESALLVQFLSSLW